MPNSVDVIIKARGIHAMDQTHRVHRSIAVSGERIVALSEDPHGLDGLRTDQTALIDEPELTLLPAIFDDHEHLLDASHNLSLVQPQQARSIDELIELIRRRAADTPPGRWIVTAAGWDESTLAEGRLPTAAELDTATNAHPVLCPRGGHVCVANSLALRLTGVTADTIPAPGGTIGHDDHGNLTGLLEGANAQLTKAVVPPAPLDQRVAELDRGCGVYASAGVGGIREALLRPGDLDVYRRAWEQGRLSIRCRPMLLVDSLWPIDKCRSYMEEQELPSTWGDDWLRTWGLKLVADGGVAGAATDHPYANDPTFRGHLNWDMVVFGEVVELAVARGWRVATHAVGDRTVREVLDAYEHALAAHPDLAPGTLAIEHAMLAPPEQRARAAALGVTITVQHNLLYTYAGEMLERWGPERTVASLPVRSWLESGVDLSAGSDAVRPINPMLTLWGMSTRGTRDAGVQGADERIDRRQALELMTVAGARLTGELDHRGTLQVGKLADLVAYPDDPLTCELDRLPTLTPLLTIVGGRAVHDPHELLTGQSVSAGVA